MAQQSKRDYVEAIDLRYRQSGRAETQRILDEFMRVCGYHRKYTIGVLNQKHPPRPAVRRVFRRQPTSGEAVIRLLAQMWDASGYLCGQRIQAAIPHWLPWLKRRTTVTPALEGQLRRISPRQIDRRLRERKQRITRRLSTGRRVRVPCSSTRDPHQD